MRIKNQTVVLFILIILINPCATIKIYSCSSVKKWASQNSIRIKPGAKDNTLAVVYTKTPFQTRFMDVGATVFNTTSDLAAGVHFNLSGDWVDPVYLERTTAHRKASSEFEMKLGSFDVLSYFSRLFEKSKDSVKYYNVIFNSDSLKSQKILDHLLTNNIKRLDSAFTRELITSGTKYVAAFKFQYGIGARAGKEQIGLKKSYRPFIRLVGAVKDVNTNTFVWENRFEVFSDRFYKGRNEALEEFDFNLIKEFKVICNKLLIFLIDDLNGKQYHIVEELVDYTTNDDRL
jgi:hypothetical protein